MLNVMYKIRKAVVIAIMGSMFLSTGAMASQFAKAKDYGGNNAYMVVDGPGYHEFRPDNNRYKDERIVMHDYRDRDYRGYRSYPIYGHCRYNGCSPYYGHGCYRDNRYSDGVGLVLGLAVLGMIIDNARNDNYQYDHGKHGYTEYYNK